MVYLFIEWQTGKKNWGKYIIQWVIALCQV